MPFNHELWGGWGNWGGAYNPPNIQAQQALLQHMILCAEQKQQAPPTDEEDDMINTFKIGCDPEFIFLNGQGKTVPASTWFLHDGEIGYDHGGRVAEFRPAPTKGVFPIIKKIQALVASEAIKKTGSKLRAGALCNGDCLGGHVHFDFNAFTRKPPAGVGILQGGTFNEKGAKVTKALDALTKALEHLDILPATESTQRRASAQGQGNYYGAYGDVRDCNGHMEYRTMASWLFDPKVAFLCLTAAKLAAVDPEGAYEALKDCDSFVKLAKWVFQYKGKDINAARAVEKLLDKGHRHLQLDPAVDFAGRWEKLGL